MYFTKINNKITCVFDGEYNILDIPEGVKFTEGKELNVFVQFDYCDINKVYSEVVKTVVTHFGTLNIDGTKGYQLAPLPPVKHISINNADTRVRSYTPNYVGQTLTIVDSVIQSFMYDCHEINIDNCEWTQQVKEHFRTVRIRDSKINISGTFNTLELRGNNQAEITSSDIHTLLIADSLDGIDIISPSTEHGTRSANIMAIQNIDANIINLNKLGVISDDIRVSDVKCNTMILTNPSKCILYIEYSEINEITIHEKVSIFMDEMLSSDKIHVVNTAGTPTENEMTKKLYVLDKISKKQELSKEEAGILRKMLYTHQVEPLFAFVPYVCANMLHKDNINIITNCIFLTGKNIQETIQSMHNLFVETKKQNKMDIFSKVISRLKSVSSFNLTFKYQYDIFGDNIDEFLSIFTKETGLKIFDSNEINVELINIIINELALSDSTGELSKTTELISRLTNTITDDIFNGVINYDGGREGESKNKIAFVLLLANKNPQYSFKRYIKESTYCTTWFIQWLNNNNILTDELLNIYANTHLKTFFIEYVDPLVSNILLKSHGQLLFNTVASMAFEKDTYLMSVGSDSLISIFKRFVKNIEQAKHFLIPMIMNDIDYYISELFPIRQVVLLVISDEEYIKKIKSLNVVDMLVKYAVKYDLIVPSYLESKLAYSNDDLTKINSIPLVLMVDKEKNKRKGNILYKKEKREIDKLYIDTVYEQKSKYSKGSKEHTICLKVENHIQQTTKNYIMIEDLMVIDDEFKRDMDNVEIYNTTIKSPFLNLILQFNNNLVNFYDEYYAKGTKLSNGDNDVELNISFDTYNGEKRNISHIYADETIDLFSKVENILFLKYKEFVENFRNVYDKRLMSALQNEFISKNTDVLTYQQIKSLDSTFEPLEYTKIINETLDQVYDILTNMRNILVEERGVVIQSQSLGRTHNQMVMRLNLKSLSLFDIINNKQQVILKESINNYMKGTGHPTSSRYLTVGWVRFLVDDDSKSIWVNEIQTDMTKICKFEESGSGMSDKLNDRLALNLLSAFKKLVFKFYEGYTIIVPSAKLRKALINGSPSVNTYDNPAKKLKFRMGQYSDTPWVKKHKGSGIVYMFNPTNESKKL